MKSIDAPRVFMDNAGTTPVDPEVFEAMKPWLTKEYGNPVSLYGLGAEAREALEEAHAQVAALINATPDEIFFTSGGTEADNWALKGVAWQMGERKGKHLIVSQVEHTAVLDSARFLEKQGFEVTYLPVDGEGFVDPAEVQKALRPDTILCSIMFANNEIGTIQPVKEIAAICREAGVYFHTAAEQAVGHIPVDVQDIGCDLLSISGHKFYGPKGVGALYIKKRVRIGSLMSGGPQEKRKRGGTHNMPGIVGLGKAAELAQKSIAWEMENLPGMRDRLVAGIFERVEDLAYNGPRDSSKRLPGNANFCVDGVEGEGTMMALSYPTDAGAYDVAVSTGSACSSGTLEPSHVLQACGIPIEWAHGSVRLSLGKFNTEDDVDYVIERLPKIIERLRNMSPTYRRGAMEDAIKEKSGSGSLAGV